MNIKFLGAAETVTGSSYLVTANSGEQILIDYGLYQGPSEIDRLNYELLPIDGKLLRGVILTHAHLDHCGRLPILMKMGFTGNIYMTAPTAEVTEISLLDSAKINKEDHPNKVLFDQNQVFDILKKFKTIGYGQTFSVGSFKVTLRDAGHIIGSASVEVENDHQKIVFSGDLGNTPEDLTKPTETVRSADIVVMESTYGDRSHPQGEAVDIIRSEINTIEQTNGVLLIPAFSIDRSQELLHIISHLKSRHEINEKTPIYLDSPMAEKVTVIYEKYRSFLNDEINRDFLSSNPFSFPGLQIIRNYKDSLKLNRTDEPKVIISGSGMMTGGRIVNHAKYFLPIPTTRLLIVGYQAKGTLGRQILDGEKEVNIEKKNIRVNAQIVDTQVMSSHADQPRLINWLKSIPGIKKVILTHGEDGPRKILADKIKTDLNISDVSLPALNQEINLS